MLFRIFFIEIIANPIITAANFMIFFKTQVYDLIIA